MTDNANVQYDTCDGSCDVIVVGSGMGGLTAAALLAKIGKKVLVIEHHDRPGGCAQSFRRKRYVFDAAVHLTSGCEQGALDGDGLIDGLLRLLDVRDMCSFIRVNPFYTAIFPDLRCSVPTGTEALIEHLARHFPKEEHGLRQFAKLSAETAREVRRFPVALSLADAFGLAKRFPEIIRYQAVTVDQVMNKYLADTRLKALLSAIWPYCGLPPSKLPFLYFSLVLMNYVEEGSYHCRGSFQNLVNAFVEALRRNGGELLLRNRVSKILLKDNSVSGVILENGHIIKAPIVISNADAAQTLEQLIGFDNLPQNFVKRVLSMKPSISTFVAYLATNMDMREAGADHEMFLFPTWDHDLNHRSVLQGMPGAPIVTIPTLSDPSLAPADEHLVTIMQIIPYDCVSSWRSEKARYVDLLLNEMEKAFPGFRESVTYVEGASPRTIERYTLNQTGAIYGWETSPRQTGSRRLGHQTPIQGLYLSGHWTQPGGGIYSVVQSGVQTTQIILGYKNIGALFNALRAEPRLMKDNSISV